MLLLKMYPCTGFYFFAHPPEGMTAKGSLRTCLIQTFWICTIFPKLKMMTGMVKGNPEEGFLYRLLSVIVLFWCPHKEPGIFCMTSSGVEEFPLSYRGNGQIRGIRSHFISFWYNVGGC